MSALAMLNLVMMNLIIINPITFKEILMKKIDFSYPALIIALICVLIAALMVFGSSLGLWDPIVGFVASRNYNNLLGYISVAAGALALIVNLYNKQFKTNIKSIVAIALGLVVLTPMMVSLIKEPTRYPPIHDITTDIQTPPQFSFLTDERAGAKNTLVYGGKEIAEQQLAAFPDIKPIKSTLSAEQAYLKSIDIAQSMGWEIAYQDQKALRFEATARTPFFNFADDVVVQVLSIETASIINVRSVSRIGRGDRGVNAQRIRDFAKAFDK